MGPTVVDGTSSHHQHDPQAPDGVLGQAVGCCRQPVHGGTQVGGGDRHAHPDTALDAGTQRAQPVALGVRVDEHRRQVRGHPEHAPRHAGSGRQPTRCP